MSKLIINWWKALTWTIKPVPNKNSIIKLIPACLLTDEKVTLNNVPKTSDVAYMLEIFEQLWWSFEWTSESSVTLEWSWVNSHIIDPELSQKMKASVMFSWPLLSRFGKVSMPLPQWCKLWTRPMDAFIENMVKMWCSYTNISWAYEIECEWWLRWATITQRFPSVTATENLILMSVLAKWTTIIYNAACEPHVQDLCQMLTAMGAKIDWLWSNKLTIEWVESLSWTTHTVISDHLDVAWLITATVMTWGEITIQNAVIEHMDLTLQAMSKLWVTVQLNIENDSIFVPRNQNLHIQKTLKWDILELAAWAWPLLPMDIMPVILVLALHCEWSAQITNSYYSTQFFFIQELAKMKARTVMSDPHRIITFWPTRRKAANLLCGDIIQSSYWMLMACIAAEWTSTLNAITPLFRRFPNFVEEFNSLWAEIELID